MASHTFVKIDDSPAMLGLPPPVDDARKGSPFSAVFQSDTSRLLAATALTGVFFFVELIGGYFANSLAIMSDAVHLSSDVAGFIISLVAIAVARYPANDAMTFGYARAEVIGAFLTICLIWALTALLCVNAVYNLFYPSPVHGDAMLVLGVLGLLVNLTLAFVLGVESPFHDHDHDHSHDHDHGHDHGHVKGDAAAASSYQTFERDGDAASSSRRDTGCADDGAAAAPESGSWMSALLGSNIESVNVRAAYLHVLGDALQSIGVILAALIIYFKPEWSFVDPLCTLLFAAMVILTTRGVMLESVTVLMEGAPENVDRRAVAARLHGIDGVSRVDRLHLWAIMTQRPVLSAHLVVAATADGAAVLRAAQRVVRDEFGIEEMTVQVNREGGKADAAAQV